MHLRSLGLAFALLVLSGCHACGSNNSTCTKDSQCKANQKCVPIKVMGTSMFGPNMCVTGAECATDQDCTAIDPRKTCNDDTHKCDFRPGFADDCDAMRPCPFGQFCSDLQGRCFDASKSRDCVRRSQCPSGQMCDLMANKCIPDLGCFGDQFCEMDEKCDLVNHVCQSNAVECATCIQDGMCPTGAMCTTDTKECLAGNQMPQCKTGEKCDPLGRCVQCTASDQCGSGLFCNVSTGRCESNVQCAQDQSQCPMSSEVRCVTCTAPEVCDPITKTCQAMPTVCAMDIDCPGDSYCNLMLNPPICVKRIPDCVEDNFDPNRGPSTAATPPDMPSPATYPNLKLCPGTEDWYKITVTGPTYLTVDLRFHEADGNLELELYLADGTTLIAASRKQTDNQRVEIDAGASTTFLLRVFYGAPSINGVPYSLIVTKDPGVACMDDANEPDDSQAQAKPIASDMPFEGVICTANPDWFVLKAVPASTHIDATLTFPSSFGHLILELYRAGQTTPLVQSASDGDLDEINSDATYAGDYYLRVLGRLADQNVYTLRVNLRANTGATCHDDRFEPNDQPTMATNAETLTATPAMGLTICSSDQDWYKLSLGSMEALTAEIGYDYPADIEVAVYPGDTTDPNAVPLRASTLSSVRQFVGLRTPTAGDFLVRVFGHGPTDTSPYELRLRRSPPLNCMPDRIDMMGKGNTMATAFPLPMPPTRLDDLTLCGNDMDWYQVTLIAGFTNLIQVHYIENDAELDIAFFANGMMLGQTGGTGVDTKELQVNVPGFGVVPGVINIVHTAGGDVGYNVTQDLIPLFTCVPDAAEPDDDPMHASTLTSSTVGPLEIKNLTLCAGTHDPMTMKGDEDWYLLRPPHAGVRINASITYQQGDLFLELFSPGGKVRACVNLGPDRCFSDNDALMDSITFTATTTQPYYLRVGSIYSSPIYGTPALPIPPNVDTSYTLDLDYTAQ
jgi:hypothetical protein